MNAPFFVEILSQNREVRHRLQVHSLPIRIGRAYDNDVILDDPRVSAHHALIEQTADGDLLMRDLGSLNGIIYKGERQTEMAIDGKMNFRIGHTSLRIRSADYSVAAEIKDSTFYNWEGSRPALVGLITIAVLAALNKWLADTSRFEAIPYMSHVATWIGVGLGWCVIWAFVNQLFGRNTRFGRHLFILGCGIAAIQVWLIISALVAYAFSLEVFTRYRSHLMIAIIAMMVFFHLLTINPRGARYYALICVMLAVSASGAMLMYNYSTKGRLADELFMSERFPPVVRQSSDKSVSQFINDARKLETKASEMRFKFAGTEAEDTGNTENTEYQK